MFLFFLFSSHRLSKMSKRKVEFDALRKKSIAASDILSWHLKKVYLEDSQQGNNLKNLGKSLLKLEYLKVCFYNFLKL